MQGLADGYFVIPYTIGDYLASNPLPKITTDHERVSRKRRITPPEPESQAARRQRPPRHPRDFTVSSVASCGTTSAWRGPRASLRRAPLEAIPRSARRVSGTNVFGARLSRQFETRGLEYAGPRGRLSRVRRVAGARRAPPQRGRAVGHFREESQTPEGEGPLRDDEHFQPYVAAWGVQGCGDGRQSSTRRCSSSTKSIRTQRSYK